MATQAPADKDQVSELITSFSAALGEGDSGSIKLYRDKGLGKKEYIGKFAVYNNNIESFVDQLRADYPGAESFYLTLINEKGQTVTNSTLHLANTKADVPATTRQQDTSSRRDSDMFMMMMQNSQKQSSDNMQMMMAMMGNQQSSLMQMMGLIIPAITGNRESPSDTLLKMAELQQKFQPQQANGVKDTLELMSAVKGFISDADPPEGLAGVMQAAAPLVAAIAAGVAAAPTQPQAQAAPGPNVRTVTPPIGAQTGAVNVPPEGAAMDQMAQMQAAMIAKFKPLMDSVKRLILKDYEPEAIAGYFEMKVESGEIDGQDADMLYQAFKGAGENLPGVLALFDIVESDHVEIVRQAIALVVEQLDSDDQSGGGERDVSSPGLDEGPQC